MTRIKMIHHINVQISDRAQTREWYEKVLGAEFLDRGPALNKRQLQLRLGDGEIHFTETDRPATIASGHFALEVDDWEAMLSHLDALGIAHVRTSAASTMPNIESVLMEKSKTGNKMKVPISETGTASIGMRVERQSCRKR